MAKLIAMHKKPADGAAFDLHYYDVHVPIARKLPGLRGYEVTRGPIVMLDGVAPYHMIAFLTFDSVTAIERALESEEGKATAADLGRFAQAGVDIAIVDTRTL